MKFWDANELVVADEYFLGGAVNCLHMSRLNQLVAAATEVNHVRLIDPRSGAGAHELRGHGPHPVATCR